MERRFVALGLAAGVAALGCGGATYNYVGYLMDKQFPLDGLREWQYLSEDETIEDPLRVEKGLTPTMIENWEVFTFETYNENTGDLLWSVDWSADTVDGILIHGYSDYREGGEDVVYSPPIVFADDQMAPGAAVVTETGGITFTSTFASVEPCPNYYVSDWDECLKMVLDDGDGDDMAGPMVAGTYWLVPRYGIAWFKTTGDESNWVLWKHNWSPE